MKTIQKNIKAKAKPKPELPKGIDSKYELDYLYVLREREYKGEIQSYYLKPGSLRLGTGSHYEPDFLVIAADGTVEYHEVKGRTRFATKSLTKIKAAAHAYQCFRFLLCMGEPVKNATGKKVLEFNIEEVE